MAIAAAAPDRSDFPAGIGVVVAGGAARRHDDPAALCGYEIADEVVGKSSRDDSATAVVPAATDSDRARSKRARSKNDPKASIAPLGRH
jgi:hypothetical protein